MNLNHWDGAESANPEIQNDEKKGKREREREKRKRKSRTKLLQLVLSKSEMVVEQEIDCWTSIPEVLGSNPTVSLLGFFALFPLMRRKEEKILSLAIG